MLLNNCSVTVPEGREIDGGYVEIPHGTVYTLLLENKRYDRRCDVKIEVDGKVVGEIQLSRYGTLRLRGPVDDNGCFTFYSVESVEAIQVGAQNVAKNDRGLVQVTFKPEYLEPEEKTSGMVYRSAKGLSDDFGGSYGGQHQNTARLRSGVGGQSATAGVTGLTGNSGQKWRTVPPLKYDPSLETVISLRLIAVVNDGPREMQSMPKSNPVPTAL